MAHNPGSERLDVESILVERVRSGDPDALQTLYRRFGPLVYTIALRFLQSRDDAEDVLQDFFVALPENLGRFHGRGSLEGWIRRVATTTSLTWLRRRSRRREVSMDAHLDRDRTRALDPGSRIIQARDLEVALGRLSERLRVVFILKEVEGYTHGEIARLLDIRPGTSEVRLYRAKQALRRILME